jgi:endonuclease/exonuclease/phosphatase family metal-dependent hydrolase
VINIHAYNWLWMRRHRQIARLLMGDIATAKDPLILGGDFNTSDQTQTYRMVNRYLQNAHWQAGCGFGFTYPSPAFNLKGKISVPALIRIDHIFHSNQIIAGKVRTLHESCGSDHFPVVADLYVNLKLPGNS